MPETLVATSETTASTSGPRHGLSYFGDLKYPEGFTHFGYVNPDAPKGGTVKIGHVATFNNLHYFADKGIPAIFTSSQTGFITYDTLMRKSEDELESWYGELAESVEVSDDYGWVKYTLRENAYWHDGVPVTVDDFIWTFNKFKEEGPVSIKNTYRDFDRIEQTGPRSFKFFFREEAEKTPQLPIQSAKFMALPKHYWQSRDFTATTLEPPLGNGPYRVAKVDPGREMIFERVEDYWGRDLNVNVGHNNFERIQVLYFFDKNVHIQALNSGVFDYYREQDEKDFATAYNIPAADKGLLNRESYTMGMPYGMHFGIVLNTRRPHLKDIRVREALTLAYNFDWANRVFWHSGHKRNDSYFMGSDLAAVGLPSEAELEILEPLRDQIPPRVFTQPVALPTNESYGRNRATLLRADRLLEEAGWTVKDFKRVNKETGEPFRIEFVVSFLYHERMLVPFVDNLKRLGVDAKIRKIESNLIYNRRRSYDFDAILFKYYNFRIPIPASIRAQHSSRYADVPNMVNYAGAKNPAVDALIEKVIGATSEQELTAAGRALDRVLLWNFYLIPEGCPKGRHLVYWDRFGHPPLGKEHMNWTGFPHLWWFNEDKSARVDAGIAALKDE